MFWVLHSFVGIIFFFLENFSLHKEMVHKKKRLAEISTKIPLRLRLDDNAQVLESRSNTIQLTDFINEK